MEAQFDASFFEGGASGLGMVARDTDGEVLAAATTYLSLLSLCYLPKQPGGSHNWRLSLALEGWCLRLIAHICSIGGRRIPMVVSTSFHLLFTLKVPVTCAII